MTKIIHDTNFLPREKRGKFPQEGDLFYYKFKGLGYGYGRVIADSDEKNRKTYLHIGTYIYLYDHFTETLEENPKLDKNNLVIDPLLVFPGDFTTGPFVKIKNIPLQKEDILDVNCMYKRKVIPIKGGDACFDFFTKKEIERSVPCGVVGVFVDLYVDVLISEAKGVPFAKNYTTENRKSNYKYW